MNPSQPKRLLEQAAVVTGAGRGIGRVLALTLAGEGARVAVSGRNVRNLEAVAEEIRSGGGEAVVIPCDVTKRDQARDLAGGMMEAFGRIDILVNNAGVHSSTALLVDVEETEWETVMATNVKGVFLVTQAVLPAMTARRSGHVITISSAAGTARSRNAVNVPYAVSKWAVEGFNHSMAMQMKPYAVRFNTLAPGPHAQRHAEILQHRRGTAGELPGGHAADRMGGGFLSASRLRNARADRRAHPLPRMGQGARHHAGEDLRGGDPGLYGKLSRGTG